jgi:Mg-chelatase subunit ChlD
MEEKMTTYITFVMDETGSMDSLKEEAISGFNKYIDDLKKNLKGRTNFSLMLFDSTKMRWHVIDKPIKDVEHLDKTTYRPGAMTPLWDAVAEAISETEKRVKGKKNPKVVITILTDGYENASRKYTTQAVKDMIESHKDWAINFLGANVDAWVIAGAIGIDVGSSMNFNFTGKGLSAGLRSASIATVNFALDKTTAQNFYEGTDDAEDYVKKS